MSLRKIFVVSSVEGKKQAACYIRHCTDKHIEYRPWWNEFQGSRIVIDELERIKNEYDGALVVLTPDVRATIRRKREWVPSLNVLFEWGFFLSKFTKANIAVVKYGAVHIPTDLGGWVLLHGSDVFNASRVKVPSARSKDEFRRWLTGVHETPRPVRSDLHVSRWKTFQVGEPLPSAVLQRPGEQ